MAADKDDLATKIKERLTSEGLGLNGTVKMLGSGKVDMAFEIPVEGLTYAQLTALTNLLGAPQKVEQDGIPAFFRYRFESAEIAQKLGLTKTAADPAKAEKKQAGESGAKKPKKGERDDDDEPDAAPSAYPDTLNEAALIAGIKAVFDSNISLLVEKMRSSDIFEPALESGVKTDLKKLDTKELKGEIDLAADCFMPPVSEQIKAAFKTAQDKGEEVGFAEKFQDYLSAAVIASKSEFEAFNAKTVADRVTMTTAVAAANANPRTKALYEASDSLNETLLKHVTSKNDPASVYVKDTEHAGIYILRDAFNADALSALKTTLEAIGIDTDVKFHPEDGQQCLRINDSDKNLAAVSNAAFAKSFEENLRVLQDAKKKPEEAKQAEEKLVEAKDDESGLDLKHGGELDSGAAAGDEHVVLSARTSEPSPGPSLDARPAADLAEAQAPAEDAANDEAEAQPQAEDAANDAAEAKRKAEAASMPKKEEEIDDENVPVATKKDVKPKDEGEEGEAKPEGLLSRAAAEVRRTLAGQRLSNPLSDKTFFTSASDETEANAENEAQLSIEEIKARCVAAIAAHNTQYAQAPSDDSDRHKVDYEVSAPSDKSIKIMDNDTGKQVASIKQGKNKGPISYKFSGDVNFNTADIILRTATDKKLILHSSKIEDIEQILKAAAAPPNAGNKSIQFDKETKKFLQRKMDEDPNQVPDIIQSKLLESDKPAAAAKAEAPAKKSFEAAKAEAPPEATPAAEEEAKPRQSPKRK